MAEVSSKFVSIDCCFCFSSGISTKFKLDGPKCKKIQLEKKIEILFGSSFMPSFERLLFSDATLCRNCFSFITRIFSFRESCLCSVQSFLSKAGVRAKRTSSAESQENTDHLYHETNEQKQDGTLHISKMGDNIPCSITDLSTDEKLYAIEAINNNNISALAQLPAVQKQSRILLAEGVSSQCLQLTIRTGDNASLLLKKKSMTDLLSSSNLFHDIAEEIRKRIPFLHYLLFQVTSSNSGDILNLKKIETAISMAYAILMFHRNNEFSLIQRLLTVICMKGNVDDMALTRLNHIGLTMSPSSKIRLLEECNIINRDALVDHLKDNPLIKITGDNLDIYVRSSMQGLDRQHKDMHMFASNVLSTRIASPDMDNTAITNPSSIDPKAMILNGYNADILRMSYKILLSRIISKDNSQLRWMEAVTPLHIPHPYSREMAKKSFIFQLPLQLKNEGKYEECIAIMDSYEDTLLKIFQEAHGNTDALDEYKVTLGGDQLTRVRLQGAKDLKRLSTSVAGRLAHLEPIVCELWHLKQDFLEKLYKTFFGKMKSRPEICTLSYFKTILRKSDVNGKVKSNFKAHSEFLCLIVKELIREQALELLESNDDIIPTNIKVATKDTKKTVKDNLLSMIMEKFGYDDVDITFHAGDPDELFNYSCQLCQWGIHFLTLNDTAKKGDVMRVIPNLMKCIPFFYSHSRLSKYLVECVDIIMKCESSSPLNRMRILEGFFVNRKGGHGSNVEADLVQEHYVRHQKDLIRALGANKSDKAILRATGAANVITSLIENYDTALNVPVKGSNHGSYENDQDLNVIRECLRSSRPFKHTPGRKCPPYRFSQQKVKVDIHHLLIDLQMIIHRLSNGFIETLTHEEDEHGENEGLEDI